MKKFFLFALLLIAVPVFSQQEWEMIHGENMSLNITHVFMVDSSHTWGNYRGDIYFSPDGGYTWNEQFQNEDYYFTDVFFIDNQTGWFVGWSEVLKTIDGGENWTLQSLPNPNGFDVEGIWFMNPDTGWIAGSYKTIYATYDGGENWISLHHYELNGSYFLYDIHFINPHHGCAVGGGLLYPGSSIIMTTVDGGATWTEIYPVIDDDFVNVHFANDTLVWASNFSGRLYKSLDGGFNWEMHEKWPHFYPTDMHFFSENEATLLDNFTQYFTDDGWNEWDSIYFTLYNSVIKFSFRDGQNGIAVGHNNFLTTTNGGHTWSRINERFSRIAFFDAENGWIIQEAMDKNLVHSDDGGYTWSEVEGNHSGSPVELSFPNESAGFVVTTNMELLKTTDAGTSWTVINIPGDSVYFTDITFLDADTGFICGGNKILRTVNGGYDWTPVCTIPNRKITGIDFMNSRKGWFVCSDSISGWTPDGGLTWHLIKLPYGLLRGVNFITAELGFINTSWNKVFRSSDGGMSWQEINFTFSQPNSPVFTDTLHGWLTDHMRVYRTSNGGITWEEYDNLHSSNWGYDLSDMFMLDTNHIWISAFDGRVFALSGIQDVNEKAKDDFVLCYPNPVTDRLNLEFNVNVFENLTAGLYSLDGRLIFRKEFNTTGINKASFDLSGCSPGLYILDIRGSSFTKSFKIIKK